MPYFAVVKFTFSDEVSSQEDAELWANSCEVAVVESEITANIVARTETIKVDKE